MRKRHGRAVTRVRIEDLPKNIRDQIDVPALKTEPTGRKRPRPSRGGADRVGPPAYRCVTCQAVFPTYGGVKGWEKHSDRSGHPRGEALQGALADGAAVDVAGPASAPDGG